MPGRDPGCVQPRQRRDDLPAPIRGRFFLITDPLEYFFENCHWFSLYPLPAGFLILTSAVLLVTAAGSNGSMPQYLTWEKARRRWVFQMRIPESLQSAFGGRTTLRQHLGDIPEAEAVARATQLAAHHKAVFEQHRNPAQKPRHTASTADVTLRFTLDDDIIQRFIATWRTQYAHEFKERLRLLRQASDREWERLEAEIEESLCDARRCLRRGGVELLQQSLASIQSELNIRLEGGGPAMESLTDAFNAGHVAFLTDCLAVIRGDTPVSALAPAPEAQLPLLDLWGSPASRLADDWRERVLSMGGRVKQKTLDKYRAIATDLGTVLTRRPVQSLTKTDVEAIKELWKKKGNGSGTLNQKRLILLSMLRPFDSDGRLEELLAHTRTGASVPKAARLAFTDVQIRQFLETIIGNPSVRRDDQMLVALLILLGTRIEEVFQLRGADFAPSTDGWLVRFADHHQTGSGDATLKNCTSARRLPLHRGAFPALDAWLEERIAKGGYIFPDGSKNKYGTRSDAAGKRLNRLVRALFPDDRRLVLQSTRSSANCAMRRAETDPRIRRRFLGHADIDIHDRHYDPAEQLDDQDLNAGSAALAAYLRDVLRG